MNMHISGSHNLLRMTYTGIDGGGGGSHYFSEPTSSTPPMCITRPSPGQFEHQLPFRDQAPAFPITPPPTDSELDLEAEKILSTATHVLSTEAVALSCLSQLYATDPICRDGFVRAVEAIVDSQQRGGKIVVIGVGKSGRIGDKLVASMNSLGLMSVFLNPVEALHGDVGIVRQKDVLLLITFSGRTPELLQLLPYLDQRCPLIALTSHTSYHTLPLISDRDNAILLPAPIPESEVSSFGIAAPTTSTTVAMALGDALSLSAANRLHESEDLDPREVFRRNHPGGAIGIANNGAMSRAGVERMRTLAVCWEEIPIADAINATDAPGMAPPSPAMSEASSESGMVDWDSGSGNSAAEQATNSCNGLLVLDCLRMAVRSPQGWLRTSDGGIISPKKLRDCLNIMEYVTHPDLGLVLDPSKQIRVPADSSVKDIAKQLVMGQVADDTVIVVLDNYGKVHGVMEAGDIIRRCGH